MKNILFMVTKSQNGGAQKWTKEQIEICSNDFKIEEIIKQYEEAII